MPPTFPVDPRRWDYSTVFSHPDTSFVRVDMRVTVPRGACGSLEFVIGEEFAKWAWAELRMSEFETQGNAADIWRMVVPYFYRVMERGRKLGVGVEFHVTYMRNGELKGW